MTGGNHFFDGDDAKPLIGLGRLTGALAMRSRQHQRARGVAFRSVNESETLQPESAATGNETYNHEVNVSAA